VGGTSWLPAPKKRGGSTEWGRGAILLGDQEERIGRFKKSGEKKHGGIEGFDGSEKSQPGGERKRKKTENPCFWMEAKEEESDGGAGGGGE